MRTKVTLILLLVAIFGSFAPAEAQRRQRPGSMKHTEADVENARRIDIVKCKYITDGGKFNSKVYATGGAGRIFLGDAILTFSNGHYQLSFTSTKMEVRDALPPQERHRFNPWRKEKVTNDFTQSGKYMTFKKAGQIYLRLYDGDTENYITDIPLSSADVNSFNLEEDGLLFEFYK